MDDYDEVSSYKIASSHLVFVKGPALMAVFDLTEEQVSIICTALTLERQMADMNLKNNTQISNLEFMKKEQERVKKRIRDIDVLLSMFGAKEGDGWQEIKIP